MMDIIFAKLPKFLDSFSIVIRKFGHRVFYLELSRGSRDTKETENHRVAKLKDASVVPLPLEDLFHFKGISKIYFDPEMKFFKRTQLIAPERLLKVFEDLFPNTNNIPDKLRVAVHSAVAPQIRYMEGKVNIWANSNRDKRILLIDVSPYGLLIDDLEPNVWLLVIPLDIGSKIFDKIINTIHQFLILLSTKCTAKKNKIRNPVEIHSRDLYQSKIAYVTHKGLDYGNLYQKNLFYSNKTDSDLHPERMIHFDYSNVASPSDKLQWVFLDNQRQSRINTIYYAIRAINRGMLKIRSFRQFLGLFILTSFYVKYQSFLKSLEGYPHLKVAIVDYEVLCPKSLLLAFETKKIRTVATQERYIVSFNNIFGCTILSHYLCTSQFAADVMTRSTLFCVDRYWPTGQYRSDNLLEAKNSPPPQILKEPLATGRRIIIALGFHTPLEWQNSQTDLVLNWKAHMQFLEDMIRLARDIPEVFIILRFKDVDWVSLPIFAEIVQKISYSDNLIISMDYEKSYISYDLCAHSDLVIAKHTSLADECLSVGIPVLFYDYAHNTERIAADAFDYSPAKIMCFNYQDLLKRVKIILSGTPNTMTADYEYLKNVVYGNLSDGKVRQRIHAHIEGMLSEI
jgi:hypothetical protein